LVAFSVLALAIGVYLADPYLLRELRARGFDELQQLWPQPPRNQVVIVDINEESLRQQGQWPWPRSLVAHLIDRIAEGKPRVLGVDLLFPEPDRLSPTQLPYFIPDLPSSVVTALAELPSNETKLAQAIAKVPTVLGMAPSEEEPAPNTAGPRKVAPVLQKGETPLPFVVTHRSLVRSLPEITRAAQAEASLGARIDDDGMVRSQPLISLVEGQLVPTLAVEVLRVAAGSPALVVTTNRNGVEAVTIGKIAIPTDAQGLAYLHFELPQPRYVSATELLAPDFDLNQLNGRIVLLAVTGLGTVDRKNTPLGMMEGVEVHAQLIESILAGTLLQRPPAVFWTELALILVPGLLVIGLPRYRHLAISAGGMIIIASLLARSRSGTVLAFRLAHRRSLRDWRNGNWLWCDDRRQFHRRAAREATARRRAGTRTRGKGSARR
jgi:adenylate cyclase